MAQETEIKLPVRDVQTFQRALRRLGARPINAAAGGVHEENVIFDTPQGGLAKHGQLLRIRTETRRPSRLTRSEAPSRAVLTFKRPVAPSSGGLAPTVSFGRHKVREEFELEISDPAVLTRVFEGLGMSGWFRYEKYRTTYRLPATAAWAKGLLLELDETPIGTFVELEGPPGAIDRAAQELGFGKRDYILKNYLALYLEECRRNGEEPRHMLFSGPKQTASSKKSK